MQVWMVSMRRNVVVVAVAYVVYAASCLAGWTRMGCDWTTLLSPPDSVSAIMLYCSERVTNVISHASNRSTLASWAPTRHARFLGLDVHSQFQRIWVQNTEHARLGI